MAWRNGKFVWTVEVFVSVSDLIGLHSRGPAEILYDVVYDE